MFFCDIYRGKGVNQGHLHFVIGTMKGGVTLHFKMILLKEFIVRAPLIHPHAN